jgi:hypothetical protein
MMNCAQGMLSKATTNAKAFGIGLSTGQERVTDEAPARGAVGGGGGRSLEIPAALWNSREQEDCTKAQEESQFARVNSRQDR